MKDRNLMHEISYSIRCSYFLIKKYLIRKVEILVRKCEILVRNLMPFNFSENVTEELSYILKVNHVLDGPTKEMMEVFNVFGKEVEMYKSIVPAFENLLRKSGDLTQFTPK